MLAFFSFASFMFLADLLGHNGLAYTELTGEIGGFDGWN